MLVSDVLYDISFYICLLVINNFLSIVTNKENNETREVIFVASYKVVATLPHFNAKSEFELCRYSYQFAIEDKSDNVDKPKEENPKFQLVCVVSKLVKRNDIVVGSNIPLLDPNKYCNVMTENYDHSITCEHTSNE